MTRFFTMTMMAGVMFSRVDSFAKGPRTILEGVLTAVSAGAVVEVHVAGHRILAGSVR